MPYNLISRTGIPLPLKGLLFKGLSGISKPRSHDTDKGAGDAICQFKVASEKTALHLSVVKSLGRIHLRAQANLLRPSSCYLIQDLLPPPTAMRMSRLSATKSQ